ncbi:MAG TPA: peptide deformylase [Pyrinomonadaceae bacterium]|nr:peptide deformylase [Pyrinomonadaceae bacterium]
MAVLKLVTWPNPILETPADPVTKFDDDLRKLADDMFETMYAAPGVGLAGVQVGIAKRLFVMDCSGGKDPLSRYFMANPEIILQEGKQAGEEGCLSIPGIYSKVHRSMRVIARGHDLNGKEFEIEGIELEARCLLHETDHCDGILYVNRITPLKREIVKRKIRKLQKAGEWPS